MKKFVGFALVTVLPLTGCINHSEVSKDTISIPSKSLPEVEIQEFKENVDDCIATGEIYRKRLVRNSFRIRIND